MNSFASSASSGDSSTIFSVRCENSARPAPCCPRVRPETICGRVNSSVIALPSAIRSGQNATSISTPSPATIFSTSAVTPGNTVERSTSSCPSRRNGAQPPSAFGIAVWFGFRCSSTGVPITTTTCSADPTTDASVVANRRPPATARSSIGLAPGSSNGSCAAFTASTAASLTS